MTLNIKCIVNASIFAALLNLLIPLMAKQFMTKEELNSNKDKLQLKKLIVHMVLHHYHHPVISSIVAIIFVSLSVSLGYAFKILK